MGHFEVKRLMREGDEGRERERNLIDLHMPAFHLCILCLQCVQGIHLYPKADLTVRPGFRESRVLVGCLYGSRERKQAGDLYAR